MNRLKRLVTLGLVGFAVLVFGCFLARGRIADWIVAQAIRETQARVGASGLGIRDLEPGHATLTGPFTLRCEGLRGRLVVPHGLVSRETEDYVFVARLLRIHVDSVFRGRVVLSLQGGSLYKMRADGEASGEWLSDLQGEAVVDVSWRDLRASIRHLEQEARQLVARGVMDLPARVRGRARFLVRRQWFEATIYSETDGRHTRVMLDRDDVRSVSAGYAQPLTETEIDLVSRYPTLAPVLLQITDRAKREAAARRRTDRSFPEDAFRHVLWSYLLTREFGAEFAQAVTDAHEIGATYERGEAARQMDLQNNAVGRDYALAGVAEQDLERRFVNDVRVRRSTR